MADYNSGILLDTHILIWFLLGTKKLTNKEIELIEKQILHDQVSIASISLWEISMLVSKEKIVLTMPVSQFLDHICNLEGLQILDITGQIAVDSCQLPGEFHGDPADRLIVATARNHNLQLMTHDKQILEYAKFRYLNIYNI